MIHKSIEQHVPGGADGMNRSIQEKMLSGISKQEEKMRRDIQLLQESKTEIETAAVEELKLTILDSDDIAVGAEHASVSPENATHRKYFSKAKKVAEHINPSPQSAIHRKTKKRPRARSGGTGDHQGFTSPSPRSSFLPLSLVLPPGPPPGTGDHPDFPSLSPPSSLLSPPSSLSTFLPRPPSPSSSHS